ncbi:MAG: hypothetical protein ACQEXX_28330 [Bacillota bacterium]
MNSAGPKQMLTKYVSSGNISGAHVPKTDDASEDVFYENVQLRFSVPSFIQLKRLKKRTSEE